MYFFTLPLAGISLGVLVVLGVRHWKEIRLLDPDSIREERLRQKRDQLITQRFERVKAERFTPIALGVKHGLLAGKTVFHAVYLKLIHLDKLYAQGKHSLGGLSPSTQEHVQALFQEARSFSRDTKWADAERRYLEILTLDDRNVEAYKGLASIYLKQKMFDQAKETYEFLIKMKKADDTSYGGLGEIAAAQGDVSRAELMYQKAIGLKPHIPHWHAVLADLYTTTGDLERAWAEAKQCVALDPKSGKYLELSLDLAIRMNDREEARRRYDQLRLLIDDRKKLDGYKERLRTMG